MFCLLWPHLWIKVQLKRPGSLDPYATWIITSESLPRCSEGLGEMHNGNFIDWVIHRMNTEWWQLFIVGGAVPVILFRRGLFKHCVSQIIYILNETPRLKCIQYFEPLYLNRRWSSVAVLRRTRVVGVSGSCLPQITSITPYPYVSICMSICTQLSSCPFLYYAA